MSQLFRKIQDESLHYESKKHDGSLPLIGVNTFLPKKGEEEETPEIELIRATEEEKRDQIEGVRNFQRQHKRETERALHQLRQVARDRGNVFESLMEAVKVASLGQISHALYEVGGSIEGICKDYMQFG